MGCSPWGHWGSDTTERLHFHFSLSCIGEGNGKPLQCSCLENPRGRGACWAAIGGVTQSRTWLKWLSSLAAKLVIAFLPRSKHLLISWLQSPSAVVFYYLKLIQLVRKTDWYFLLLYRLSKPPGRKYAKEKPVEKVFKNVFFIYSTIQFKKAALYNENKTSFRACQSPTQILFFFFFQFYWDIISI